MNDPVSIIVLVLIGIFSIVGYTIVITAWYYGDEWSNKVKEWRAKIRRRK